jgi:type II secretory pathway pseudopilin PulG
MKLLPHSHHPARVNRRRRSGMTLVEVMIASTLMIVIIGGLMASNFVGLRENQLMQSKAGANDSSRYAINQLLQDIRAAKGYDIGSACSGTNFTVITNGNYQGPALRLYTAILTTNQNIDTSQYIIYNFDTTQIANNNGMLWRTTPSNGVPVTTLVTSNLINTLWFTSENYQGSTQTVKTYKGVVHTTLQFSQFLYPVTPVGSNSLFNYYRIDCRATPHLPDGP